MPLRTTKLDCRPRARPARAKLPPPRSTGTSPASWASRLVWKTATLLVQFTGTGPKQRPWGRLWLGRMGES